MPDSEVVEVPGRNDEQVWQDILKLQLDGVMHHIVLFEIFSKNGLCGFANMHKHHAEEEFDKYLHTSGDFIQEYGTILTNLDVKAPALFIKGNTKEEMMNDGLAVYLNWENTVCQKLKTYKDELKQGKEHIEHLICDVKNEKKYIRCMQNDLDEGRSEELDRWLIKKFK